MKSASLLMVGLEEKERQALARSANRYDVIGAGTIREATQLLRSRFVPVIVCRHTLPDGDWRDLLNLSAVWKPPAKLIVVSRVADNRLWSEVLNLGGYDLLAAPLDEREVSYVLGSACHDSYSEGSHQEESLAGALPVDTEEAI